MLAVSNGELASLGSYAGRMLLGAIFLQAGVQKLRHRVELGGVVANYRILPERWVAPFSFVLPWAELVLAILLWFGPAAAGGVCASVLLTAFCVGVAINLARGRTHIDCGCFQSSLRQTLSPRILLRNATLLAIAAAVAVIGDTTTTPLLVKVVAGCFGGVCFALYLAMNEVLVQGLPVPELPSFKAKMT
jgi:hypothetical protein